MDTITGAEEIKDFVLALEVDKWKLETLPEEATEIGSFGLTQEEPLNWDRRIRMEHFLTLLPLHYMMETISVLKLAGLTWHLK